MEYDMPLFRPPSEARSLIFQVTLGCSWNRCVFCVSYKTKTYRVRSFEELELTHCKFGTEHASNYLPIHGMSLPGDKERIPHLIDGALAEGSPDLFRPEWARGL